MTEPRHRVELRGCTPIPLAHYLKALGVLRLVSEQADPTAQGWWENETFSLRSKLDREALLRFFLLEYQPTPLVAPWNGGSGFYPKDNQAAIKAITSSTASRFATYREVIGLCRDLLTELALTEKPEEEQKPILLRQCRNRLPDAALPWLDAAYLLTADGPKFPPLLGTGGNDGRLEFTNNYMQRITEVLDAESGQPLQGVELALAESLFGALSTERSRAPIGQFDPGSAGGANAAAGYDAAPGINSWDFVLLLEGTLAFAAASTKKLESAEPGVLAYPFCVRPSGLGYASADASDEQMSRAEMWMPLWNQPATFNAVSALLSEGRVETNRRRARTGIDFARAIAALGVDRGISSFERFGFQQRNGLAYFAVPLGRFDVHGSPAAEELLSPLDGWLETFRRAASSKTAPAAAGRALRRLEAAILRLCRRRADEIRSRAVQDILIALGHAEAVLAMSKKLREADASGSGVRPVPLLSPQWLVDSYEDSPEFRLAAALASVRDSKVGAMRRHLEPIAFGGSKEGWVEWAESADDPSIVWGGGDLVHNLHAVLQRRLVGILQFGGKRSAESAASEEAERSRSSHSAEMLMPLRGRCPASLGDIAAFINEEVDDRRIEALLRGLMLLDWRSAGLECPRGFEDPMPDAAYALLKLCHLPEPPEKNSVPIAPEITRGAIAGHAAAATRLAAQRLLASRYAPAVREVSCSDKRMRRVAAALVFPISPASVRRLMELVLDRTKRVPQQAENRDLPATVAATAD